MVVFVKYKESRIILFFQIQLRGTPTLECEELIHFIRLREKN